MKAIIKKQFPFLIKWFFLLKIIIEEKKLTPNRVTLNHSKNFLFADPFESRGFSLLRNKGAGQPYIKKYWRTAMNLFRPDIALDVGANYGEVFLDNNYPDFVKKIIGVEANPFLYNYLIKSKKSHPQKEKIAIINGLAADENIEEVTFFIDKTSSGRSTALPQNFVRKTVEIKVSSYRLDDWILNLKLDLKTILFKIDVEGFEPFVLNGMNKFHNLNIDQIGCIEFNLTSLQRNEMDIEAYLNKLNENFNMLLLNKKGTLINVENLTIPFLRQHFDNKYIEGDILLFTNPEHLKIFRHKFK